MASKRPTQREVLRNLDNDNFLLRERLAELELALENQGWTRLYDLTKWEFSREFLTRIVAFARLMFLKNPMIKRLVEVQKLYVWALGNEIKTKHPIVKKVIEAFLHDDKNREVLGSLRARAKLEEELQVTGNLFFAFFVNRSTGQVRIRTIDVDQITEIKTNPEDAIEPWYYRRAYNDAKGNQVIVWYPDWHWEPKVKPKEIDGQPIQWDVPVYHVKVGGLSRMAFGVPEVYSALDWALAYKTFLENWSTIMSAYARLAMQISGLKGSKGVAAAKSKMGTAVTSTTSIGETNPPNTTAAWFMTTPGVDVKAIKTAGATTSAEEGRPLRLMVAAGGGLPDTFLGDADVGNFATSQTLDRPTELKMVDRQKLWTDVLADILAFVIQWSVRAPEGELRQAGATFQRVWDELDGSYEYTIEMPNNTDAAGGDVGKPISTVIEITFPSILDRNISERVRACVGAFTLLGNQPTDIIWDKRLVARFLLEALGEPNVDQILDHLYPPDKPVPKFEPVDYNAKSNPLNPDAAIPDVSKKPKGKEK